MAERFPYHFDEDKYLEEFYNYVKATYGEHYVQKDQEQVFHHIMRMGDGGAFARGNIIKLISRYGKKGQPKDWRKDILKAMHYLLLFLYVHDNNNNKDETGATNSPDKGHSR